MNIETTILETVSQLNQYGARTTRTMCEVRYDGQPVRYEIATYAREGCASRGTEIYAHGNDAPRFEGYYTDLQGVMGPYMKDIVAEHGRRVLVAMADNAKRAEWRTVTV